MITALYIAGYLLIGFLLGLLIVYLDLKQLRKERRQQYEIDSYKYGPGFSVLITMTVIWPVVIIMKIFFLILKLIIDLL